MWALTARIYANYNIWAWLSHNLLKSVSDELNHHPIIPYGFDRIDESMKPQRTIPSGRGADLKLGASLFSKKSVQNFEIDFGVSGFPGRKLKWWPCKQGLRHSQVGPHGSKSNLWGIPQYHPWFICHCDTHTMCEITHLKPNNNTQIRTQGIDVRLSRVRKEELKIWGHFNCGAAQSKYERCANQAMLVLSTNWKSLPLLWSSVKFRKIIAQFCLLMAPTFDFVNWVYRTQHDHCWSPMQLLECYNTLTNICCLPDSDQATISSTVKLASVGYHSTPTSGL